MGTLSLMLVTSMTIMPASSSVFAANANQSSGSEVTDNLGPVTSKDTIYQIITDRFVDGDKSNNVPDGFASDLYDGTGKDLKLYQGGDWKGIIDKIPYLKEMGITAVWISAPYENRDDEILDYQKDGSLNKWTSFHGYHVRNYFATNKHFGKLNEFKELRDALHDNDMKLVIDFVTNHTSRYQNPTAGFKAEDGKLYEPDKLEDGSYAIGEDGEPYDYNGDGKVENLVADPNNDKNGWFHNAGDRGDDSTLWGYRNRDLGSLADFNQENPQVVSFLENATTYWANLGIDGIRHDATLHMNPAFVKGLKDKVDSNNTVTQFGEYFIGRPDPKYNDYVYFTEQTGVNNLDFEMYRSLTSTFGDFSQPMSDFAKMLQYTQKDYSYENQAVTFLDNHDVTRFGYLQQNHKVYDAALAVLMTSRGIPNIYYGTEQYVKPADGSDVAGRVFMQTDCKFDQNTSAYKVIKKLSDLRKESNAIAYGETNVLYSDKDVVVYERQFYDDVVVVAVNRQPDKTASVPEIVTNLATGNYSDYLDGALLGGSNEVKSNGKNNTLNGFELLGGEVSIWTNKADKSSSPRIGDVVSTMGSAGNKVYISGQGFSKDVTVKFGKVNAKIEKVSDTEIVTRVPDDAVAGYNEITVVKDCKASNSFIYNVLSGDQNQVVFHVKAETNYGENIYIVGDIPELGSWDVDKCTEVMFSKNYPEWYLPVSVPAGTKINFKFIKKDSNGKVTWESGENHVITSSSDSTGVIDTETFNWRY